AVPTRSRASGCTLGRAAVGLGRLELRGQTDVHRRDTVRESNAPAEKVSCPLNCCIQNYTPGLAACAKTGLARRASRAGLSRTRGLSLALQLRVVVRLLQRRDPDGQRVAAGSGRSCVRPA